MRFSHLYDTRIGNGLKPLITALNKLPYTPVEIVDILKTIHDEIPNDSENEDYCLFVLVLADQFKRKGFDTPAIYEEARDIIERALGSENLATIQTLKKQHVKTLSQLKHRLQSPVEAKKRTIKKTPQKLIFARGNVFTFPVYGKNYQSINPYCANRDKSLEAPTGWRVGLVINSHLIFDYLACYRVLLCEATLDEKDAKDFGKVLAMKSWNICPPGTCSPTHYKRLEIEKVGHIELGETMELLVSRFSKKIQGSATCLQYDGVFQAIADISIGNWFKVKGPILHSLVEIGVHV